MGGGRSGLNLDGAPPDLQSCKAGANIDTRPSNLSQPSTLPLSNKATNVIASSAHNPTVASQQHHTISNQE